MNTDSFTLLVSLWIPGLLGIYALTFIAGGIYYLEQRVSRIRDQFPQRGLLAMLTGWTALGIGFLMSIAIATHFAAPGPDSRLGALVATVAGVGFWVYRIHIDQTPLARIRDAALTFICTALAALAIWWVNVLN